MGHRDAWGATAVLAVLSLTVPAAAHADVSGVAADATAYVARWFEHGARLWSALASRLSLQPRQSSIRRSLDKAERHARFTDVERVSVVVQDEREASPEMLTVRCRLTGDRGFETYAGAGLSRARYLESHTGDGSVYWIDESRRSYAAAAELGAAWRADDRLELRAELRWLDHGDDHRLMRTTAGMIDADPLFAGLRVGWRFR